MSEPYIWRVACGREYKAESRPTCGCQKCWDKYKERK